MQLAMKASHAPRRNGNVARCPFSKQKASISQVAAEAEVTLINARKVTATSTNLGFKFRSLASDQVSQIVPVLRLVPVRMAPAALDPHVISKRKPSRSKL